MAFYPSAALVTEQGHKLRVEIGPLYVACSIINEHKPLAFEFFELENDINDWSDVFFEIKNNSRLLDKHNGSIDIFYNFKEALLIPVEKLSSAAAVDYLSLIYGESSRHEIKYDKLSDQRGMANVYRIKKTVIDQAVRHFHLFQAQHVYTAILNQLFSRTDIPVNFLKIQVYPQSVIIVLMTEKQLQIIKTFSFETTEDICFYLLSVLQEHKLTVENTTIEMSGFIEPHNDLHKRLQQLFPKRSFSNMDESLLLPGMLESHHPHYFTPFFNVTA